MSVSEGSDVRKVAEQLNGPPGGQPIANPILRPFLAQIARYWWVELPLGVFWVVIAVVVLKFDNASVVTVGVLTGTFRGWASTPPWDRRPTRARSEPPSRHTAAFLTSGCCGPSLGL